MAEKADIQAINDRLAGGPPEGVSEADWQLVREAMADPDVLLARLTDLLRRTNKEADRRAVSSDSRRMRTRYGGSFTTLRRSRRT